MKTSEQLGFRALADSTRRDILKLLAGEEMTIAEVAENFDITRAAVKKHLTILSDGGLINIRAQGRTRINALNPEGIKRVFDWFSYFDAFWEERMSDLKDAIEKDTQ